MTDRAKFEQMLESLINGDQKQAEEIFHDLVVAKSREIYENLLDDDIQVDEEKDLDEDEDVEENFDMDMQEVGGDPADDMMGDMDADEEGESEFGDDEDESDDDMGDDEGGDEAATKDDVMDIKDALVDLKAEFEAMLSGKKMGDVDGDGDHDMADHDAEKKEDYQFEEDEDEEGVVREYVEKVAPAKMGDNGANIKSIVAGKNPLGNTGTSSNIVNGGTEAGVEANKGHLKGSSLFKGTPKDLNSGNVNVPGSKNATKMSPTKGHGAEKKGAGEQAANTRSIVGK
jgi:hypothetical protein